MKTVAWYALPVVIAAGLAWSVEHYRLSAELADVRQGHVEQLLALEQANTDELELAARKAESLQAQLAALDARYTQELQDAQAHNTELRDAVDVGTRRLRILAQRPAACPAVPGAADGAGLGDGAAVELSATAGRAYFRLRAGLTSDTAKLVACQAILSNIAADREPTGG